MKIKEIIKLLRIQHYIKNILIFAPLLFGGALLNSMKLISALLGFFAFSSISSVVYILNDIKDRKQDGMHPEKCRRPVASGAVSVRNAVYLLLLVFLLGMGCNFLISDLWGTLWLLIYIILNVGYSFGLKNFPLLDIIIIAAGFLIRVAYGSAITDIAISNWLYLTVLTFSLSFALGKRRGEYIRVGVAPTRMVLKEYPIAFLDKAMTLCLTLANGFYALWCMDRNHSVSNDLLDGDPLILTFPVVLIITLRYCLDIEKGIEGDPVEIVLADKTLLGLLILFAVVMLFILYIN